MPSKDYSRYFDSRKWKAALRKAQGERAPEERYRHLAKANIARALARTEAMKARAGVRTLLITRMVEQ